MSVREFDARPPARSRTPFDPERVGFDFGEALTAATSATTIYTPRATGIYRLTVLLLVTTGGDAINLTPNAIFTDAVGTVTQAMTARSLSATGRFCDRFEFRANADTAIQFSTTLSGARIASVWSLYWTLERIKNR